MLGMFHHNKNMKEEKKTITSSLSASFPGHSVDVFPQPLDYPSL